MRDVKKEVPVLTYPPFIMQTKQFLPAIAFLFLTALSQSQLCFAQDNEAPAPEGNSEIATMFPHSQTARWWVSGQANVVFQAHPDFHAAYSGAHSMHAQA